MQQGWLILAAVAAAGAAAPVLFGAQRGITNVWASPHVKLRSVDLGDVRWTGGFWADRFERCRTVTLPAVHEALKDRRNGAVLENFRIAAGLAKGKPAGTNWSDGDCYKFLEAVTCVWGVTGDPKLQQLLDTWIEAIAKAQRADGYISTPVQLDGAKKPWQDRIHHELYNMGHLMTAACVHHRVTGKDTFLAVARKLADYLWGVFSPRPKELAHYGWNPSNIMGLVELYRTTRQARYLELAGIFVDMRGSAPGGSDWNQYRVPLRKETEAVGHAVTAAYLWAGAADVCAETGEAALREALERLWEDVTARKMFITGGIGSYQRCTSPRGDPVGEAFSLAYDLPNREAYCETCANIAGAMWNRRMLDLTGEARYADEMERVLYNSMLSAIGVDGKGFFYANPLLHVPSGKRPSGHHGSQRQDRLGCYCCPPQVARTIAQLHGWAYGVGDRAVWVHLYGSSTLRTELPGGAKVRLSQQTNYPWDGEVKLTVDEAPPGELALMLRIPGWAEGASVKVNGRAWRGPVRPGTYVPLRRTWSAGDVVELHLPMPVRLMQAHPKVRDCVGKVAVLRGPVVYCVEIGLAEDNARAWKEGIFFPENIRLTPRFEPKLLGGLTVLEGDALTFKGRDAFVKQTASARPPEEADWTGILYRPLTPRDLPRPTAGTVPVAMIPYYAWANRGVSYMEVWAPLAQPQVK